MTSRVRSLALGLSTVSTVDDEPSSATVRTMANSFLVKKKSKAAGVVPAAASFAVPGAGQLLNGQGKKALATFGVAMATGAAFLTGLPLLGGVIGVAHLVAHGYAVGDAYIQARKKR
jgi:TM2 domain-containing membrane protein YozV